jgi:hypothetical protein
MVRHKRPLTFVPAVLFLSTGIAVSVGSIFYSQARAAAVENRPLDRQGAAASSAYLEITQTAADRYDVVWRTPVLGIRSLPIAVQLPSRIRTVTEPVVRELTDSHVERRTIAVDGGLEGTRIRFDGLESTATDVVVRLQRQDGSHTMLVVHPSQAWFDMPGPTLLERSFHQLAVRWPLLGII